VSLVVPEGNGVSSSALVEVASMQVVAPAHGDYHIVMDQMASACCEANKLLAMVFQWYLKPDLRDEICFYCSGSGIGTLVEPLPAVPLNDELQQARALVAKAEADVLLEIMHKMQTDLDDIENLFNTIIRLDVINARATYSISFGGTYPYLFSLEDPSHREKMHKAIKDVSDACAENRRRRQQIGIVSQREEETSLSISSLEAQVAKLKKTSSVPVDIFVA
nr:DNA mismatch repair protein MutS, core [Tanacetum cinerariifolium]